MNYSTDNTRIIDKVDLVTPNDVISKYPLTDEISKLVYGTRNEVSQILHGKDDRLIAVVGPCSIHDPDSAEEYAKLLIDEKKKYEEDILLIMRVYFEKPRTSIGWKGLINDPDMDNTFDANKGLFLARSILHKISQLGLPVGTEFLDPISPQFVADLISWGAIGARTAESQIHRELASGLSCPIGFKNGTTGDLNPAIYGMKASNHSHVFFSNTKEGMVSIYKTSGNSDTHIILRGGTKPNLYPDDIRETIDALNEANANDSIMIDVSHGNSQKVFKRQLENIGVVSKQISDGMNEIRGVMIESHLREGNQKIGEDLEYGQSVTDACIHFEDTKQCLSELSSAVQARRSKS